MKVMVKNVCKNETILGIQAEIKSPIDDVVGKSIRTCIINFIIVTRLYSC